MRRQGASFETLKIYTISDTSFYTISRGGGVCWRISENILMINSAPVVNRFEVFTPEGVSVIAGSQSSDGYGDPQFIPSQNEFISTSLTSTGYRYSLADMSVTSTFNFTEDRAFRWHVSPDGGRIVFTNFHASGYSGVWVMDINGANLVQLR